MAELLNQSLKILVVDDHALIREALRNVLKQLDAEVAVFEAADCAEAFELADIHPDLDLCLLDLQLPGIDGFTGLAELQARYPAIAVVMLSASDDRADVTRALDHGAVGFISKSSPCSVMLSALNLVLAGGVYLPPEMLNKQRTGGAVQSSANPPGMRRPVAELGLTERQLEVLALMTQGKPNKVICRDLGLAEGTVKIHVTAILKALRASSRTQAVLAAGQLDFGKSASAAGSETADGRGANPQVAEDKGEAGEAKGFKAGLARRAS